MLSTTTKLEELSLVMTNPHPTSLRFHLSNKGPAQPVSLPNLRILRWNFCPKFHTDVAQLLSWLDTPALDTFDVAFLPNSTHTRTPALSTRLHFPVPQYRQVQSLSMEWSESAETSKLLRSLAFPNLKSLRLKCPIAYGPLLPQSTPQLAALLKDPRFPFLESLVLENFALGADDLREVLRWMPVLKSVECISCTGVGNIAKILSEVSEDRIGDERAGLLQRVDCLTFKRCPDLRIDPLINAVNARNGVGTTRVKSSPSMSTQQKMLSPGGCTYLSTSPTPDNASPNATQILQILHIRRIEPPLGPSGLKPPYAQISLSDGAQYFHAKMGAGLEGLLKTRADWRNVVVEVTRSEIDVPTKGDPLVTITAMNVIHEEEGRIGQPEGVSIQNPREATSEVAVEFHRCCGPVPTTPISTVWIQDCEMVHEVEVEELKKLVEHVEYIR